MPLDYIHVVTCGVMLNVHFGFLEGNTLQPMCVQHCPPVLNVVQVLPPGQTENQKWKVKITLPILLSSVPFWWKTLSFGLDSRIAGAEAWQCPGRFTFTQSFHTRRLDSKAEKVLSLVLNHDIFAWILGHNFSPKNDHRESNTWGLRIEPLIQLAFTNLILKSVSGFRKTLHYTKWMMSSPFQIKPIKLHYAWATPQSSKSNTCHCLWSARSSKECLAKTGFKETEIRRWRPRKQLSRS